MLTPAGLRGPSGGAVAGLGGPSPAEPAGSVLPTGGAPGLGREPGLLPVRPLQPGRRKS